MDGERKRTAAPGAGKQEGPLPEANAERAAGDACRCEETSKMTPRELLGLMMKDLAFWKRTKKE